MGGFGGELGGGRALPVVGYGYLVGGGCAGREVEVGVVDDQHRSENLRILCI